MELDHKGKLNILVIPKPGSPFYNVAVSLYFVYFLGVVLVAALVMNVWMTRKYFGVKNNKVVYQAATAQGDDEARTTAKIESLQQEAKNLMREIETLRVENKDLNDKLQKLFTNDYMDKLPGEQSFLVPRTGINPSIEEVSITLASIRGEVDSRRQFMNTVENHISSTVVEMDHIPLASPVKALHITSSVGYRMHPILNKVGFHKGVDLMGTLGAPARATASGIVIVAGPRGGYGNEVIIDHLNGFKTCYAHLETPLVHVGDRVRKGTLIGLIGSTGLSTGPHLHYEIYFDGKLQDPAVYLKLKLADLL